ncbi:MAG TPA: hypothetical protein VE029_01145 [Rhizobacter sp.]|nr:hypothetical protein [Rhizobacter sp.]
MQVRLAARIAAIALAGAAYVAVSHWLMTQTQASAWNVVVVLMPMLVAVAIGAWHSRQRWVAACAALGLAALCAQAAMGMKVSTHVLYLAQHAGINLFLALVFGSTLRAGHTALITTLARRVHGGHLVAAMAVYTRKLTRAWTIFFIGIVLVSVALYAFASFDAWAFFANLVTPIAVAVMFGTEYLIRYRLHPEFERSSVADAVRAYLHGTKAPAQAAPCDPAA